MQVNAWELFAHPLLLDQLEMLMAAVKKEKANRPKDYQSTANFKLLAALYELLFVTIPDDPTRPEYRQGNTLGNDYKHWFMRRPEVSTLLSVRLESEGHRLRVGKRRLKANLRRTPLDQLCAAPSARAEGRQTLPALRCSAGDSGSERRAGVGGLAARSGRHR